jgi:hypothetical protein
MITKEKRQAEKRKFRSLSNKARVLRGLRYSLRQAEKQECTCSDFTLQYEGGCQCDRGKLIASLNDRLWNLIDVF